MSGISLTGDRGKAPGRSSGTPRGVVHGIRGPAASWGNSAGEVLLWEPSKAQSQGRSA